MDEITIGREEFKALSSDTRINIIKLLNERNYTLSEISAKMNMSSPTIKQHLETLVHSDLIQQKDEGRKWKYYYLTRKGKKLIEPESEPRVMILLAASIIGIVFLAYTLIGTGISFSAGEQFNAPSNEKTLYSNKDSQIVGAAEDTTNADTTKKDDERNTENWTKEIPEDNTGIILALVLVSLIAGFIASKATEKKGI